MVKSKQSGQMVIEMILIFTLTFGMVTVVASYFKDQEIFNTIVSGPWQRLAGMIENGVWMAPKDSYSLHPNQRRASTVEEE